MRTIWIAALSLAFSLGTAKAGSFEAPVIPALETELLQSASGLNPDALHAALTTFESLRAKGEVHSSFLSVIDYSLPSTAKRMWVFDLDARRIVFNELVAHGRNTGEDVAVTFSNDDGSYKSSLGAFVTGDAYDGKNGYSMRLRGLEPNLNDHAEKRAIVLHGAWYVDEALATSQGRIGRSLGCPAVRPAIARELIDDIKDGSVLYAWHPSLATAHP